MWAKHRRGLQSAALAAAMGWAVLCGGCREKPVEPKPEPSDNKMYFSSETAGFPKLFALNTTTLAIDSVDIPWGSLGGVTVSARGDRLYVNDGSKVHVINASTMSLIAELPYPSLSPVAISPDNRLVAITGQDLTILRTSDYSVVFFDTNISYNGVFSSDSKTFFCATRASSQSDRIVYSLNLSRRPYRVIQKGFSGSVAHVVPSRDNTKWFIYVSTGIFSSAFEAYDVATDSVVFRKPITPGRGGQIAMTQDDRYVFYSNPEGGLNGPPAPWGFSVYDVRANTAREIIDTAFFSGYYSGDSLLWVSVPTYLAVTPDGRWLVMMSGLFTAQVVYLWDIPAGQPVFRWMGYPRQFLNLSVKPNRLSRF